MNTFAIDPGTHKSAYVLYDGERILEKDILSNVDLLAYLHARRRGRIDIEGVTIVVEFPESYGMPVGKTVFETCYWAGRFVGYSASVLRVFRSDVKIHLCNTKVAKDSNVRQVLIDRFPPTGGGKIPQIGIKSNPGPLYGVVKDVWSALAVAVYYHETYYHPEPKP